MTDEPQPPAENLPNDRRLANLKKGKPFVKGYDPRRNMRAVPKETTLIREKMRMIAAEIIGEGTDAQMTRFEAMLRQFFTSRNPAHNKLALQVLDPKILIEQTDVTTNGKDINKVIIEYVEDSTPEITPSTEINQSEPQEV